MASIFNRFVKKNKEEKIKNIYDDGSLWELPDEVTSEETTMQSPIRSLMKKQSTGFESGTLNAIRNSKPNIEKDPLQSGRNQMNYYTRKLDEIGQEAEAPNILEKLGGGAMSLLTRIGAVPSAVSNTIAGGVGKELEHSRKADERIKDDSRMQQIKDMGFTPINVNGTWQLKESTYKKGYEEANNLLSSIKTDSLKERNMLKEAGETVKGAVSSGANTLSGVLTGKYSDKNVDWGKVLEENRINPNTTVSGLVKGVEAPGYYGAKHIFGVDEEKAQNWGNIIGDIGISWFEGKFTDLDGAGKTIKALRNSDKLDDVSKVTKIDDALKLAKKYNSYDDFVSDLGKKASKYSDVKLKNMYDKSLNTYAKDLIKDANKGLGGINNFEGLKLGSNVIITPEKISKISKNDTQRRLLEVGLSLYSPVGGLMNNPITDGIKDTVGKTEVGKALSKDMNRLFKGGKNNEWINAMKDNPKKALEYANEKKQVKLVKKMSDKKIQETMDTIVKYSDMKETPEELTKIIEEPVTRVAREVKVEREINNPEYISKMMQLGQGEYNKQVNSLKVMQNKLKVQKEDLLKTAKNGNELTKGIDSEINNLQKRIDRLNKVEKIKSLDFNKHMKKFGYKEDYTDLFNKAISTDIKDLTKQVGDRDLAEALQESANRVLDTLDSQFPGLSENFTSYTKIDKNKIARGTQSAFKNEEILDKARKYNIKVNGEELLTNEAYKDKVNKTILKKEKELIDWEKFSKNNEVFKANKYEGSGDLVDDILDIGYKRKNGVEAPMLQYSEQYKNKLDELKELKRKRTPFELEIETPEQLKARKAEIKKIEKYLDSTEIRSIKSGGKASEYTGELYIEPNSFTQKENEALAKKLNETKLSKYDNLAKKLKGEEITGLGYLDGKTAKKYADTVIDELGINKKKSEVVKGLMLDGSDYVKKLKKEAYDDMFDTVMNLSDDEFDMVRSQLNRRGEVVVGSSRKTTPIGKQLDEIDSIKQKSLNLEKDISVQGKDRTKWLEEEEAKRAMTRAEYDGTKVNKLDDLTTKELEIKDNKDRIAKLKQGIEASRKPQEALQEVAIDTNNNIPNTNKIAPTAKDNAPIAKENIPVVKKDIPKANKTVPITNKTPLGKAVRQSLPNDMKDMVGIKLNTASGEIVIDKNIPQSQLKKILDVRKYGSAETGSKIIYTNTPIKGDGAIATYINKTDTIMINVKALNKTQTQTILEHEMGHRTLQKMMKEFPNLTEEKVGLPLMMYVSNLDNKQKEKFIDIMTKANKGNQATKEMLDIGIVSRYLSFVSSNSNAKTLTNETYAEMFSLYNNKNSTVAKQMRKLDPKAYDTFLEKVSSLKTDEVVDVSKLVRKRFGDDYANQILELNNKKNSINTIGETMKKAVEIKETNLKIEDIKKDLKNLELSMDKHEFDVDGNIVSTDYDTFFNEMKTRNPKAVKQIDDTVPRYKKLFELEEVIDEIDNTSKLSNEAKEYIEKYKAEMKRIALRENIYSEDEAEAFTTYVAHMIDPKHSDDLELVERGRKLKAELENPVNVYERTRKRLGTIQDINNIEEAETGIRIFDENINRILLKRSMESEKNFLKKSQVDRVLEEFSIPVINNFDKHINSADYFMEHFGEEVKSKLNLDDKQLKYVFRDSGKSSYEFLKENLFEDFKKGLPDLSTMNKNEFKKYINSLDISDSSKGRAIGTFNKGNTAKLEDVLFEAKYAKSNKFEVARGLMEKYDYNDYIKNPLDKIPKTTDDGRPYVHIDNFKGDRTKEMPYGILGELREKSDPIKAYNEFIYKEAKNRNMILVEIPSEKPETIMKRTISDSNLVKSLEDRSKLSDKISNLINADKKAIEGFDALAGYNVIDPKKISLEAFVDDSGKKRILIDKNAWENYQKAIKDMEYKQKNAVLKIYDKANNMFKSQAIFSVGFHSRNGIQNVIASYTKAGVNLLDPKKNKEAIDILRYKAGNLKEMTKEFGGYNVDEILLQAEKSGIFETEVKNEFVKEGVNEFLKGKTDKLKPKKTPLIKKANPFSTDFVGYKASMKLGGLIEEEAKIVNIITHLESGLDLSDAIELTKNALFDYSELTQFESKVMKRVMPFYTFMRNNIPSQIDNFANHGARMQRVERFYNKASEKNETDRERALRPDYLDGMLSIGNQKFVNFGQATDDLKKLTNPLEMASGLNPVIKTPIELMFNKQMYSGYDISRYDKPSEKAIYALKNTVPITKQVTALHKLLTGTEQEKERAVKTFNKFAGSLVNEYDIDKQEKSTMYEYIRQLQNQYYEYLEKHPEAKEELEKQNKKNNGDFVSPIKKLMKKR